MLHHWPQQKCVHELVDKQEEGEGNLPVFYTHFLSWNFQNKTEEMLLVFFTKWQLV